MPFSGTGWGNGPWGTVPWGQGPYATFPFTPGYVFAEAMAYSTRVQRFEDLTEQRYLLSRDRGMMLGYEWTTASSRWVADVSTFFLTAGGPASEFVARDHRSGLDYVVRFNDNTLSHLRGPGMIRQIPQVKFRATRYLTYGEVVQADSPNVWWRLNDGDPTTSANTAWEQSSKHGRYSAATFTASGGLIGDPVTAAFFDGGGPRVDIYWSASISDVFTIEARIQRGTLTNAERPIFITHGGASTGNRAFLVGSAGILRAIANSIQYAVSTPTAAITDTDWHHVAWTKDGAGSMLYLDGVNVTAGSSVSAALTAVGSCRIASAGNPGAGPLDFLGYIGDVAVYSGSLTAESVRRHYLHMTRP